MGKHYPVVDKWDEIIKADGIQLNARFTIPKKRGREINGRTYTLSTSSKHASSTISSVQLERGRYKMIKIKIRMMMIRLPS